MRDKIVEAFRLGYQAGHEDTVEGNYGDPLDKAEDYFDDIKNKRHPDPNGVLKLTPEELEEFAMLNKSSPNVVVFISGGQVFCRYDKFEFSVYRYESILWLSNLFELEV